jgi:hypothetical protein
MMTYDYREVTVMSDVCNEAENSSLPARTRQTTKHKKHPRPTTRHDMTSNSIKYEDDK